MEFTTVELCAGAGGQALGLEQAGFAHLACVEIDPHACATLRTNRPNWNVIETDLHKWDGSAFKGVDLLAGGVPCPPFSVAGKQLGHEDARDLFPRVLELTKQIKPNALMVENVRGLLSPKFDTYRQNIDFSLRSMGYYPQWMLLNASDFGVPQLRPRVIMVAFRNGLEQHFSWPEPIVNGAPTVGESLYELMRENGWKYAKTWAQNANKIAPTLVGGSKKHGGPDLGPTRARAAWAELGVNGSTLAETAPQPNFEGQPRLTVRMAARIQGFPSEWEFVGTKTNTYRQVGNAFPPPVAAAVGRQIVSALLRGQMKVSA